jgi:two-component system, NtrC family, sensor kinase
MHDLSKFTLKDMVECGVKLRQMGSNARSMEEVSNNILKYLYENIGDGQTQEKSCVLIRLFKTHNFHDLEPHLQEFAKKRLTQENITDNLRCLTLLATVGKEEKWNNRYNSVNHQAIPLINKELIINKMPMIAQLIEQFGLEINDVINSNPHLYIESLKNNFNAFYIPDVQDSKFIPAQKTFVIPFNIKSVLSFGGILPDNNLFILILFSKVKIPKTTAQMFSSLALNIKMAILPFTYHKIFENYQTPPQLNQESFQLLSDSFQLLSELKTQNLTLSQLLQVSENTTLTQSQALENTIRQLKITQEKLIQSKKKAELKQQEAEKANLAKSEFLAMMSHEIRTPMNGVIGMTSLLLDTNLTPQQRDFVETIRHSGDSLLTIINEILDFSKIESGKLELELQPFNLQDCIESALDLFTKTAGEKEIELAYYFDFFAPKNVIGDITRVRQILVNLLNNAIKFTENKGEVIISVFADHCNLITQQWEIKFA